MKRVSFILGLWQLNIVKKKRMAARERKPDLERVKIEEVRMMKMMVVYIFLRNGNLVILSRWRV